MKWLQITFLHVIVESKSDINPMRLPSLTMMTMMEQLIFAISLRHPMLDNNKNKKMHKLWIE